MGKNAPMDKEKRIREEERLVRPPRLEGKVKNAGINQIPKPKKKRRDV